MLVTVQVQKKNLILKSGKIFLKKISFQHLTQFFFIKKYLMIKEKKVICISSVSGAYVSAAPSTYAIAKSALNNFVRHVSKSLTKENIILNCVSPGNIFLKEGLG